jgi:glyoxylase-like metal-dependent hydrolase (beta-lactamase superfamily II)
LKIVPIAPYSFGANTYAIISDGHAIVIDPSVTVNAIASAVADEGAVIDAVVLTHGHFDHIVSIDTMRDALGIDVYIHEADAEMLTDGSKNAFLTFFGRDRAYRPADKTLKDGDILKVGEAEIKVIHTPGHSKGSICLLGDDFIVTGDTLFSDTVGRSDLWGGNQAELAASLQRLRLLDRSIMIYAGHGAPERLGIALDNSAYYF